MFFNREPVAITAFIRAVVLLFVAFGLTLTAGQIASIMLVVELGLAMLVRSKVTPTGGQEG